MFGECAVAFPAMLNFVVDALATYRLTRLVVEDEFPPVREPIDNFIRGLDEDDWRAKLLQCPWCVGFWIAGSVVVARTTAGKAWDPLAKALAFSAVTGVVSEKV